MNDYIVGTGFLAVGSWSLVFLANRSFTNSIRHWLLVGATKNQIKSVNYFLINFSRFVRFLGRRVFSESSIFSSQYK